ncbi:MAG: diguanylate cyclase [Actinomycetota bacterium]
MIHSSRDEDTEGLFELQTTSRDVTERKHSERALREAEERFRSAFDLAAIGVAMVSEDGRFIRVDRSLCRILGYVEAELLGMMFQEITHPEDLEKDLRYTHQVLAGEIDHYQMEKRYIHADGHYVWALPNRRLLWDRIEHALDRTGRRAESLAVIFMDLDDFKTVNDRFGHSVGDEVLRQTADRLTTLMRSGDTLARLGGDEFVIVCEDLLDGRALDSILTRIDEAMASPMDIGPLRLTVSLSAGVALPEPGAGVDDVVAQADRSMYRMKRRRATP